MRQNICLDYENARGRNATQAAVIGNVISIRDHHPSRPRLFRSTGLNLRPNRMSGPSPRAPCTHPNGYAADDQHRVRVVLIEHGVQERRHVGPALVSGRLARGLDRGHDGLQVQFVGHRDNSPPHVLQVVERRTHLQHRP